MNQDAPAATAATPEPYDFSLVLGGPLYQILRRAHLTGTALELLARRVVAISLLTWLPLLLLTAIEGRAWGQSVSVPFLLDVDVHARFLLALPLFVVAELLVHQRTRMVIRQFVERGLVTGAARRQFDAAIASALRLRNSVAAEVLLIAIVYGVGVLFLWRRYMSIDVPTWYATPEAASGSRQPSLAGWWYGCVSLPLIQFILLRWYLRLFIWTRFLWQVSRMELNLVPTHPDRAGGLGFLAATVHAFAPLLAGQGVMLAGLMANRIFFVGADLLDFKFELIAIVAVMVLVVLVPISVFAPCLGRAKRTGLLEYGSLAQRYTRAFDQKWVHGGTRSDEPLLGSGDIQSLADLGNSFQVVREMRWLPFTKETVLQLALTTLLPVAPLVLTKIPLNQLLERFLNVVF